jgi:hypothetical protein
MSWASRSALRAEFGEVLGEQPVPKLCERLIGRIRLG